MITIRTYQTGDAKGIYSLFSDFTPYQRDAAFWIWINRMLSDEKSIISVAESNGKIVGHYAIIPRKCVIDGIKYNAGLGIHAFVHPDYREKISIFEISSNAYKVAKLKGLDFIYGFPNANYRLIQEKIERWKKVSLFSSFEKSTKNIQSYILQYEWEEITNNDFEKFLIINETTEISLKDNRNYFIQPLNYIINRYINHPQKPYKCFLLKIDNKYIGFVITKVFETKTERSAHIIDYSLISDSYEESLVDDFEIKFKDNVDKIVLWSESFYNKNLLKEKKYTDNGFETFFGIKLINNNLKNIEKDILDIKKWRLLMGDSDAF